MSLTNIKLLLQIGVESHECFDYKQNVVKDVGVYIVAVRDTWPNYVCPRSAMIPQANNALNALIRNFHLLIQQCVPTIYAGQQWNFSFWTKWRCFLSNLMGRIGT